MPSPDGRCASDRQRELGERGGDRKCWVDVDCQFVVASAEILDERQPGDDNLSGAIGA